MEKSGIISVLEVAQKHQNRHPDLMIGYAIGLTALDYEVAVRYAVILDGHNVFKGCPDGISKDEYELIRARYTVIHESVKRYGLEGLYVGRETLSGMIDALRSSPR